MKAPRVIIPREHQAAPAGEVLPVGSIININNFEAEEEKVVKLEQWIASTVGHAVAKQYPRLQWRVSVNVQTGVVLVVCPLISTTKGWHVHIGTRTMEEIVRVALRGAGEILERGGIGRGPGVDVSELDHCIRDVRGNVLRPDLAPEQISGDDVKRKIGLQ